MAFYRSLISTVTLLVIALYSTISFGNNTSDHSKFYSLSLSDLGKVKITTATGNSTSLDKAPATASVITSAEIEALGARNLDEILETVPGLHVSLSPLNRLDSLFSIRGIHTGFNPHVLLLKDGIPIQYSLQGGRPLLFRIPVKNIKQVEIIRGPGSAIYGADAYSGVINIITKDVANIDKFEIGSGAGSFGSSELWLQGKKELKEWSVVYNLDYKKGDGDSGRRIKSDLQTNLDAALATNASLAPGSLSTPYEILDTQISFQSQHWSINFWNWKSDNSGVGAGAAQALDSRGQDNSKLFQSNLSYDTKTNIRNWNHIARLSYQRYHTQAQLNLLPPGNLIPIGTDGNVNFVAPAGLVSFPDGLIGNPGAITKDTQIDFISSYTGFENHRFRINLGAKHQTLNSNESKNFGPGVIDGSEPTISGTLTDVSNSSFVYAKDTSRTIRYISLQQEWHFAADWELTTGLRYDYYSDFGGTANPRIALVWATSEKITSKLLYGSAFRAPSFSERFYENNPVSLGKPDLDPEVIDTLEASFNFNFTDQIKTSLNIFYYKAQDMIEFTPDEDGTTSTAQNARDQKGKGLEWELNWIIKPRLHIRSNFSWQDPEDYKTKNDITDAPQTQYSAVLNWEFYENWYFNTVINHVGDRARAGGDTRKKIDNYTLVNFNVKWKNVVQGLDLALSVRNASDNNAKEPSNGTIPNDYPLESRSTWVDIRYSY